MTHFIKRPVAFRVQRANNDGLTLSKTEWRYFADEAEAVREADALMADCQCLYVRDGTGIAAEWQPIETAPRDGSHILAYRMPIGIRFTNNTNPPTVVHWFDDPDQPGFYTSVNELAPNNPFNPTHWMPLPAPPGYGD